MEIVPLGDSALIVRVRKNFDGAPDEALNAVLATRRLLENAHLPGVIELAPAYTTVGVFFDPVRVVASGAKPDEVFEWLAERIREVILNANEVRADRMETSPIQIPVCYDAEFALDLDEIAQHAGLGAQGRRVVPLLEKKFPSAQSRSAERRPEFIRYSRRAAGI